jgi:hypothetical protein
VHEFGGNARWASAAELYADIDSVRSGEAPWKTYRVRYQGLLPPGTPPRWMTQEYELCTRDIRQLLHNQLGTTAFKDHVDYVPYRQFNHGGHRVWSNLMSGEWAWKQAVCAFFLHLFFYFLRSETLPERHNPRREPPRVYVLPFRCWQ